MHPSVPKLIVGIYLLSGHPGAAQRRRTGCDRRGARAAGQHPAAHWPAALVTAPTRWLASVQLLAAAGARPPAETQRRRTRVYNSTSSRPSTRCGTSSFSAATGWRSLRRAAVRRRPRRHLLRSRRRTIRRVHGDGVPAAPAPVPRSTRTPAGPGASGRDGGSPRARADADEAIRGHPPGTTSCFPSRGERGHAGGPGSCIVTPAGPTSAGSPRCPTATSCGRGECSGWPQRGGGWAIPGIGRRARAPHVLAASSPPRGPHGLRRGRRRRRDGDLPHPRHCARPTRARADVPPHTATSVRLVDPGPYRTIRHIAGPRRSETSGGRS